MPRKPEGHPEYATAEALVGGQSIPLELTAPHDSAVFVLQEERIALHSPVTEQVRVRLPVSPVSHAPSTVEPTLAFALGQTSSGAQNDGMQVFTGASQNGVWSGEKLNGRQRRVMEPAKYLGHAATAVVPPSVIVHGDSKARQQFIGIWIPKA